MPEIPQTPSSDREGTELLSASNPQNDLASELKMIRARFSEYKGISFGWDEISHDFEVALAASCILAEKVGIECQNFENLMLVFSENAASIPMDVLKVVIQNFIDGLSYDQSRASALSGMFRKLMDLLSNFTHIISPEVIKEVIRGLSLFSIHWNVTAEVISSIENYINSVSEYEKTTPTIIFLIQKKAPTYIGLRDSTLKYAQLG